MTCPRDSMIQGDQCPALLQNRLFLGQRYFSDYGDGSPDGQTYALQFDAVGFSGNASFAGVNSSFVLACRFNGYCPPGGNCGNNYTALYDLDFYFLSGPLAGGFQHGQLRIQLVDRPGRFQLVLSANPTDCTRPFLDQPTYSGVMRCMLARPAPAASDIGWPDTRRRLPPGVPRRHPWPLPQLAARSLGRLQHVCAQPNQQRRELHLLPRRHGRLPGPERRRAEPHARP
jgi:hypothetical protein